MTKKIIIIFFFIASIMAFFMVKTWQLVPDGFPCKTEKVTERNLYHTLNTSGAIALKEVYRIGSLVAGIVKKVYVKENQTVKKGDLIAEIDLGKRDSEYRYALHTYECAKKELDYLEKSLQRHQALFHAKQLSLDAFERIKRDRDIAIERVKAHEALLDKAQYELDNAFIRAPQDGTIISLTISQGAAVINDFQNVLCEIAQNINDLEARLDIDESDIGHLKVGQQVLLSVNSFPQQLFRGVITTMSATPKRAGQLNQPKDDEPGFYRALVALHDTKLPLKPGMTTHAKIAIDKRKACKTINGLAFQINHELLVALAKNFGKKITFFTKEEKKELRKKEPNSTLQFAWTMTATSIDERAITVGMTDNSYWEVLKGLDEHDQVIVDIDEELAVKGSPKTTLWGWSL